MEGEKSCSNGVEMEKDTTTEGKTSPEDLVAKGRREAACGKYQEAVILFEEACSELATKHDQMADEMAEPYFLYGKALLEVARQEAGVLGTAVPENEPESNGESDGEDEKEGEGSGGGDAKDGARQDDNASANAETTKETSVESPKDKAQGMDVDKPAADTTTAEGDQVGSSSKEPTAASQENKEECSLGDDENEKGEEEGEEDGEEEIADVPTLQLAWEVLELARIIYDKEADKNGPRLAEIHLHLGEINMESDHQEEAVEEFRKALQIRESLLSPDDRRIAECHFQLGMALTFSKEFDKAVESYEFAKGVLKKKLESLSASGEDGEPAKDEMKEIRELLPDLDSKIEDVVEMKKMAAQQASECKEESGSGFDAPQLKGDAKPVQISVRRGKQSPAKDVIKMIRKRGSVGKVEGIGNAADEDESAAKRLKSDEANKTAEAAGNEQ